MGVGVGVEVVAEAGLQMSSRMGAPPSTTNRGRPW
ncbi:MAG: hypothetical protein RIS76_1045 [Verrucomicrobiota bacterium]